MPQLTKEEFMALIKEIDSNAIPLTMNLSADKEEKALKECEDYLNKKIVDIRSISPLAVHFIISKLSSSEQIKFLKENIDYIREHDKDIFLYTLMCPRSLSYYLSYEVLKELKNIDKDIFKKVVIQNPENLFNGFKHEDYLAFYKEFSDEIKESDNWEFVNGIYYHNRCCYDRESNCDINKAFEIQREYNKEFITFILNNYKDKIATLEKRELLYFIKYIEDVEDYKKFIRDNFDRINTALKTIYEYDLEEYLSELDSTYQEILISNFFDSIINKNNVKKIVFSISPRIVMDIYKKNKELFSELTLNDWIKLSSKNRYFTNDIRSILDSFEITNIEELFDSNFYSSIWHKEDVTALKYIELKYRSNSTNCRVENIDLNTSIFSDKFINNLNGLKELFKNNKISKSDELYKKHLTIFIMYLKSKNIITNIEDNYFNEVEKLFYKIVMGKSLTVVYEINNIEDITMINRIGGLEFKADEFTISQIENYNVKHHKKLYSLVETTDWRRRDYKKLLLKLLLMVGFDNSKALLLIDNSLPVLEHLVGNVDIKNIELDNQGNPILNSKIINLLFGDNYSRIREMLNDKNSDLYKYFPRIFNEWEMIQINEKDKSLKTVLDYLKSDDISLPPKYYRLEGLFKYIGCGNSIVAETLKLHDEMLERCDSTICRVSGERDNYTYEVLRYDDFESLAVGNKTDCCFTVLGNGYSCLKHGVVSQNGRIFVVKKDGEIIAHSWLWRNGDLLCFDNIEISKKISCVDFFDLYLEAADKIIEESYVAEGVNNCIKNVTVGFTNFDKEIIGIKDYPCLVFRSCNLKEKDFDSRLGKNRKYVDNLPQPLEVVTYSDSKNVQYLIRGTDRFKLGQSAYLYQDERNSVLHYDCDTEYDESYLDKICKIINALRYRKLELEDKISDYKNIDLDRVSELYCNDDWYYIIYTNGVIETYRFSYDERSKDELDKILCSPKEKVKK
ncbi:MAG: hypothetical protein IJ463_03965 [Bacilli bacterium]|nr:hypothetical protein [Bacilli bacterium]